ncbi:Major facilitator superfamily domain-containing protein 8 [Channa argus]|uniref:Major facilitator superfamily domain-containing protein 8 n=1 Tax=Channa argus TaxID=215402 RepID=A0A6G1QAB7_CHAAH|nr:Major facilitator superfamily domain-containing protein 8 [Channa argus]
MDNHQKRNLTFFTMGLIFMLSGIEYAVILPTIWKYLQILEAPPYFLGLGLSAFSLTGLLTGPLFGFWSDRTKTTKSIILFSNVFEISGVGAGAGSSIFGFLTRSTRPEERAGVFAAIMACRQAGLLVGPAFNLFLRLCDFKLGPFVVNKYTSPGIFMCLLWVLLQFVVLAMYWDVPHIISEEGAVMMEMKQEEGDEEEVPLISSDEEPVHTYSAVNSNQLETSTSSEMQQVCGASEISSPFKNFSASREFLREEVVVLLTAQFITLFNQTALETMVTPLTQRYFSFGELGNSLMYSLCGVEVILGFFFVRWLSTKVADRAVLAVGLVICSTACIWCLIFLCNPQGADLSNKTYTNTPRLTCKGMHSKNGYNLVRHPFSVSVVCVVTQYSVALLGYNCTSPVNDTVQALAGQQELMKVMTALSYDRLTEPRTVQCA